VRIRQTARKAFDLTRLGTGPGERLLSALILGAAFFFVVLLLAHLVGFGRGPGVGLALVAFGSFMATSVVLVLWKSDAELEEQAPRLREELAVLRAAVLQARAEREAEERARAAEREAEERARAAERAAEEELRKAGREAAEEARAVEAAGLPRFCPSCGTKLRAPDNTAGREAKCPKCGESVNIGGVTPEPPPVVKVYTPPVAAVYTPPAGQGVEVAPEPEKKACPFCGETVLAVARKCKHCGETIDVPLHAAEVRAAPVASVDVEPDYPPVRAVACPHCGRAMSQDGRLASQVVACPHCGGAVLMPPPAAVSGQPALPPPVNLAFATPTHMSTAPGAADEEEREQVTSTKKPGCGQQAGGCLLLIVLACGGMGYVVVNTPTRTPEQIAEDYKRQEDQDANTQSALLKKINEAQREAGGQVISRTEVKQGKVTLYVTDVWYGPSKESRLEFVRTLWAVTKKAGGTGLSLRAPTGEEVGGYSEWSGAWVE
jgi:predicted RNA-binding Zn-ribbon protein involved in translation (DUF1610 family)